MKIDKIIPCVCCDHEPDCGDSVYYGMPQLKVCAGENQEFYEAFCPNCGRGGLIQFKSAYLALKDWNEMQERLHTIQNYIEEGSKNVYESKL